MAYLCFQVVALVVFGVVIGARSEDSSTSDSDYENFLVIANEGLLRNSANLETEEDDSELDVTAEAEGTETAESQVDPMMAAFYAYYYYPLSGNQAPDYLLDDYTDRTTAVEQYSTLMKDADPMVVFDYGITDYAPGSSHPSELAMIRVY